MKTGPDVVATTREDQASGADETIRRAGRRDGQRPIAVREPSINGRLDEVGREEGERDCLVDLTDAAALAACDGFGAGVGIGHEFLEPTAPPRNRCNQERAAFGTDGSGLRRSDTGTSTSRRRVDGVLRHGTSTRVGVLRPCGFGTTAVSKFDNELIRLDLNPHDMGLIRTVSSIAQGA